MKEKKQRNGKQDFSRQENKNFFQKDMELELLIEDMGTEGEGIGKKEGVAFFVKDAVLGDMGENHENEEKLRICPSHSGIEALSLPDRASVSHVPPVRRLPDSGFGLWKTVGI